MLDMYGMLLTEKQFDALDLYYNEDLSLAEMAEQYGISRQGVRGTIQDGLAALMDFEDKLNLVSKEQELTGKLEKIKEFLDNEYIDDASVILNDLLKREG